MKHLKIIHSHVEHKAAMKRLIQLMEKDPEPGTPEGDELDALGLLIHKYEDEHFPMDPPDPIEAIKFMMDQRGLKKKDLIPYIGSASKVAEVLDGTRSLSLAMIRRLSEGLKIPVELLAQPCLSRKGVCAR